MDRKLIDTLLIELLNLPEERRTAEKILANLTRPQLPPTFPSPSPAHRCKSSTFNWRPLSTNS